MNRTNTKFHNHKLNEHCDAVEEEFQKLLQEMDDGRDKRGETDNFYVCMDEYYGRGVNDKKHDSPTKRLMTMKNTACEHKKIMSENIQRGEYSMTYISSPGKSYIIEPHDGELNYDLAKKNPNKFYDQVFNQ